ncbi:hypothetical protein BOS5A_10678 [Bosea sp. EC-HK365B]|nr:hypothetical protein BOSE46_10192 [Bosea sp. 46]CAD5249335.1 hypothetical protein BOSE21B_10397 [Bosea sp. 21B]CAD5266818.1 hypothetical protein BOSE7B_150740 [Bosea sp. 7B]VVT45055.1 hypothetical protein BOS5A_10678 [Bosea sp. EC-HK365B]VXC53253.1 hypothetical protein BOSE127_190366 [Bosea sp. 127]
MRIGIDRAPIRHAAGIEATEARRVDLRRLAEGIAVGGVGKAPDRAAMEQFVVGQPWHCGIAQEIGDGIEAGERKAGAVVALHGFANTGEPRQAWRKGGRPAHLRGKEDDTACHDAGDHNPGMPCCGLHRPPILGR